MEQLLDRCTTEFRRVARNLRDRRWRAGLVVALLAIAMAANTLVFSQPTCSCSGAFRIRMPSG